MILGVNELLIKLSTLFIGFTINADAASPTADTPVDATSPRVDIAGDVTSPTAEDTFCDADCNGAA